MISLRDRLRQTEPLADTKQVLCSPSSAGDDARLRSAFMTPSIPATSVIALRICSASDTPSRSSTVCSDCAVRSVRTGIARVLIVAAALTLQAQAPAITTA